MCRSPSEGEMFLHNWIALTPEPMIEIKVVECTDHLTYFKSLINLVGSLCSKMSSNIHEMQLAFANLCHLWHRWHALLTVKGGIYCAQQSALHYVMAVQHSLPR